jgi:hypothetical protein
MASAACGEPPPPELIVTPVPARLRLGEPGRIQVSIASREALPAAVLTVSATPGLEASPVRVELPPLPPVGGGPSRRAGSPPDPPALGLVPMRSFSLIPKAIGDHTVTVTLAYGDRQVSRTVTIAVSRD